MQVSPIFFFFKFRYFILSHCQYLYRPSWQPSIVTLQNTIKISSRRPLITMYMHQ